MFGISLRYSFKSQIVCLNLLSCRKTLIFAQSLKISKKRIGDGDAENFDQILTLPVLNFDDGR